MRAALAQSVERRLGKAEVGGSIPLGSLRKTLDDYQGFFFGMKKRGKGYEEDNSHDRRRYLEKPVVLCNSADSGEFISAIV